MVLVEAPNLLPQGDAAHRVEAGGGLVEEQHGGLMDQRQREVEAAAHAARVGADPTVGRRGQADPLEQAVGPGVGFLAGDAVQDGLELEQLAAGHEGVDGRVLQRHADGPAHLTASLTTS